MAHDPHADSVERRLLSIEHNVERIARTVEGDAALEIPPLRAEIKDAREEIGAIKEERQRVKYILYGVSIAVGAGGLTSGGTFVLVLKTLTGAGP